MSPINFDYFQCIEMAVFDVSALNGSTYTIMNGPSQYLIFSGTGFEQSIKIMKIFNGSTANIIVSYDGVTRHEFFPAGATIIIDLETNAAEDSAYGSGTLIGRKGQVLYGLLSGSAGIGDLYIAGYR